MSIIQAIIGSTGRARPVFNITYLYNSVDEGGTNTVSYSYENYFTPVTLYWTISNASTTNADWNNNTVPSGSLYLDGTGSGSFSFSPKADHLTEGQEYCYLYIGTTPGNSDIYSTTIYINDTSLSDPARIANFDGILYTGSGAWYNSDAPNPDTLGIDVTNLTWDNTTKSFTPTNSAITNTSSVFGTKRPTIATWVYWNNTPGSGSGDEPLVSGYTNGSIAWQLRVDNANTLELVKWAVQGQQVNIGYSLQSGQWYHIVAAVDDTETRYYVNGVKVNTFTSSSNISTLTDQLILNPRNNMNVKYGKVQLYNYALSDIAVKGLYNSECADYSLSEINRPDVLLFNASGPTAYLDPMLYDTSGVLADQVAGSYPLVMSNAGGSISYIPKLHRGKFASNGASQNDMLKMTRDMRSGNYTVLHAQRRTAGHDGRLLGTTNNWLLGTWFTYQNVYHPGGNYAWVSPAGGSTGPDSSYTYDTKWHIQIGTVNTTGDNYKYYKNGVKVEDNAYGTNGPQNLCVFGNEGYPAEYATGESGILVVWDRVLSDQEILDAYNYFRTRYGL